MYNVQCAISIYIRLKVIIITSKEVFLVIMEYRIDIYKDHRENKYCVVVEDSKGIIDIIDLLAELWEKNDGFVLLFDKRTKKMHVLSNTF